MGRLVSRQIMAQSAQTWPMWEVTCENVRFTLGVDVGGVIRYVSTTSPRLTTPDGVRVGDSYATVRQKTGRTVVLEPGWAWYVDLPSGWYAMIASTDVGSSNTLPGPDSQVTSVFQRIGYSDPPADDPCASTE